MQYTRPGQPIKKSFSWSYSKLKNYRTCPRRYHDIDVAKLYKEDEAVPGTPLYDGNRIHKAFEERVRDSKKLPADLAHYEEAMLRVLTLPGNILVEQQLAITEDLGKCEWFAKNAWFRGKVDVLAINGPVACAIDYKTGKILEDSEQLALMAECIFSHYPQVKAVRTEFWWMNDDAATREDFFRDKRSLTWAKTMPDVLALKQAHETMTFPPTPNGLCKRWCKVTGCPKHGVGNG